jgi:hypothetical protein
MKHISILTLAGFFAALLFSVAPAIATPQLVEVPKTFYPKPTKRRN